MDRDPALTLLEPGEGDQRRPGAGLVRCSGLSQTSTATFLCTSAGAKLNEQHSQWPEPPPGTRTFVKIRSKIWMRIKRTQAAVKVLFQTWSLCSDLQLLCPQL